MQVVAGTWKVSGNEREGTRTVLGTGRDHPNERDWAQPPVKRNAAEGARFTLNCAIEESMNGSLPDNARET
jgi:hypothetical protein